MLVNIHKTVPQIFTETTPPNKKKRNRVLPYNLFFTSSGIPAEKWELMQGVIVCPFFPRKQKHEYMKQNVSVFAGTWRIAWTRSKGFIFFRNTFCTVVFLNVRFQWNIRSLKRSATFLFYVHIFLHRNCVLVLTDPSSSLEIISKVACQSIHKSKMC